MRGAPPPPPPPLAVVPPFMGPPPPPGSHHMRAYAGHMMAFHGKLICRYHIASVLPLL
jgi:la-related protein 1